MINARHAATDLGKHNIHSQMVDPMQMHSVLFMSYIDLVLVMYRSCLCHVSILSMPCIDIVYVMYLYCLCHVSILSTSCIDLVYVMYQSRRLTSDRVGTTFPILHFSARLLSTLLCWPWPLPVAY